MTYQCFPDRERALSQLDRHRTTPKPSERQVKMAEDARVALEAAGRTMSPLHEAMMQMAASAPALLAQTAPTASKFIEAIKGQARTA
ncbi:hypothetical protein ACIQ6R_16075 [Streptomyces sp. NPDC096048]|uniref:hypothetical protein n=1 Tax=Streptomyces sp. NPDC096048 TaxID=3366072 RepID=UPI003815352E